jgi:hypothetical protein
VVLPNGEQEYMLIMHYPPDALCLIQDGPDFAAEVQNMEVIYGNAAWTLVSASAVHANTPLPRLQRGSDITCISQHEKVVAGKPLAVVLPCLGVVLQKSTWNKRAWTYQESVLSHRLLIVTDSQMYFTCRHGYTFYEDTSVEDVDEFQKDRDGQIFGGEDNPVTNFEKYAEVVQEYTGRQISFHEDAQNAISGVLTSFRSWFRGEFKFGLPQTELDQALLWYPKGDVMRRTDQSGKQLFPSWSWVGWVGPCQYWSGLALSRIQWKLEGTKESRYIKSDALREPDNSAQDWYCQRWTEKFLDDPLAMDLQTYDSCWHEQDRPDVLYLHPVAVESERKPLRLLESNDGRLHIRALTCTLKVTGVHSTEFGSTIGLPCSETQHSICALNVYNADSRVCGTIHVPASLSIALHPGNYTFVRLSRTHLVCDETRYHVFPADWDEFDSPSDETLEEMIGLDLEEDDDYEVVNDIGDEDGLAFDGDVFPKDVPWCIYNVMLIETQEGVSRRIGLGKVHINAFFQKSPSVWEDVILI